MTKTVPPETAMSNILITGISSYIGGSFAAYLREHTAHTVEGISLRDSAWRDRSFACYDTVFHAVGLTHVRETPQNAPAYFAVNRDLTLEVARKAKAEDVRQFIYMSSMSVYGVDEGVITPATRPAPVSNYGRSKLEAETGLRRLEDEHFKVCILRPPMVYGKGCKGNYHTMVSLIEKTPVFPKIENRRSVLGIENLCSFLTVAVDRQLEGLYFPQNRERVCTTDMALWIAEGLGKKLLISRAGGAFTHLLLPLSKTARKAFCSLSYEETESMDYSYCVSDSRESIIRSVR